MAETATRCIVCGSQLGAAPQPARTTFESQVEAISLESPPRIVAPVLPDAATESHTVTSRASGWIAALRMAPGSMLAVGGGIFTLLLVALGIVLVWVSSSGATTGASEAPAVIASAPATFTPNPTPSTTPPPTNTPLPPVSHVAVEGDSCTGLALAYDVSVESILQLNGLSQACQIKVGQEVFIPQPTHTPDPRASSRAEQSTDPFQPSRHVVEEGDTLHSIAQQYNVDFDVLVAANDIEAPDYMIKIGQELVIPSGKPQPATAP